MEYILLFVENFPKKVIWGKIENVLFKKGHQLFCVREVIEDTSGLKTTFILQDILDFHLTL